MPKTLRTFKLSDATMEQLRWLADRGRNGNQTAVVEIAVDRMYTEERSAMHTINRIDWYVDTADLFTGNGVSYTELADVDVYASTQRYLGLVEEALREAYPDAEITAHTESATAPGTSAHVRVNGMTGTPECGEVADVIGRVFARDWTVTRWWRYEELPLDDLTATDLRLEADDILARGEGPVQYAAVEVEGHAEKIAVLYAPELGRAGLAWGADADWTDCDSLEDAIRRYLGGGMDN
jgi:hypothetical protein